MANIGFVGLGQMGGAMSRNLIKDGHSLKVFDVNTDAVAQLVAEGAAAASSGKDAASGAEVVFTMLPIGAIVEQAVFGADGIAEGMAKDAILIDMSTILPDETRAIGGRLAEMGIAMVDAPVGRTSAHAAAGTSTFMVGGEEADVQKVMPRDKVQQEKHHAGPKQRGADKTQDCSG